MFKLKRIYFVLLLLAWFAAFVISAKGQTMTFQNLYGSSTDFLGNFIQPTADGGYIICGAKGLPGSTGYYDYSLLKIDAYGYEEWTKTIGDSLHNEQAQCIRQTDDGGYIVFGSRSVSSSSVAWMVKTDENGDTLWTAKQQGSNATRYGCGIIATADGGYQTASYDHVAASTNIFQLEKTSATGTVQWGPANVGTSLGLSSSIALTNDGNYISVATSATAYDNATTNYYSTITLIKTDPDGAQLWSKTFKANPGHGAFNYLQGFGVQATADGGYVICGSTTINSNGSTDIFLLKTNSTGDSLWSKHYGGSSNDVALSVKEVPGGGFVMTGNTRSFGRGETDIFILRTTAAGDSLWMNMFGGSTDQSAGNIEVTSDSGFVVVGSSKSFTDALNSIVVVRTNAQGTFSNTLITSSPEIKSQNLFSAFPNPAADQLHINYMLPSPADVLVLYTAEGKQVYSEKLNNATGSVTVDVSTLSNGLYFSAIESNGTFIERKTLVIQH